MQIEDHLPIIDIVLSGYLSSQRHFVECTVYGGLQSHHPSLDRNSIKDGPRLRHFFVGQLTLVAYQFSYSRSTILVLGKGVGPDLGRSSERELIRSATFLLREPSETVGQFQTDRQILLRKAPGS